jgi:DNA-directed RNA polymerase specialized sigma24 family protein
MSPSGASSEIIRTPNKLPSVVEEPSLQKYSRLRDWTLSASAFHRLLTWLDEDETTTGQSYLELRRRLVGYFDRKKCRSAEELADDTLNRVARRLEEEGRIQSETPEKYCYIVARFVFMEYVRAEKRFSPLEEANSKEATPETADEEQAREKMLACLDRCTRTLDSANRELILGYYIGKEQVKIQNRRALAENLGITQNALAIRACRIRERLRSCVERCLGSVLK